MLGPLLRFLSACGGAWHTSPNHAHSPASDSDAASAEEGRDGLLWWRDLARCAAGDLSAALVQANHVLEDQCRLHSAPPLGTVLGLFDGHAGHRAARFACDHFVPNLREAASGPGGVTEDAIRGAFAATEGAFIAEVARQFDTQPDVATVGSCCLLGVVHGRTLFVANLGDSRAVLGRKVGRGNGQVVAEQLSSEHNANMEDVRQELMAEHPDDPQIVALKHGVWRVKGIIQVSRSLGDAYLKDAKFNTELIKPKFRVSEPFSRPIMSADPSIVSRSLQPSDSFVIFASDGLWEHLSNQEAVEIVHNNQRAVLLDSHSYKLAKLPRLDVLRVRITLFTVEIVHNNQRSGSAKRLIKAALQEAARKREMRYSDLMSIDKKVRRHFHDDITVIVLFFNHDLLAKGNAHGPPLSIRCPLDN